MYIVDKDTKKNTITVGTKDDQQLFHEGLTAVQRQRSGKVYATPLKATAKIRYRQADQSITLKQMKKNTVNVYFDQSQRAITP